MALPDITTDPCGRAQALRAVRDERILDGNASQTRHRTFDSEREMRFEKFDPAALDRLIREADAACSSLTGQPNPTGRHAMRGGSFGDGNPPYPRRCPTIGS